MTPIWGGLSGGGSVRGGLLAALWLWSLAGAGPALAHKLKAFAAAEGAVISGYAYFSGGGRAQGSLVVMTGPEGTPRFEALTDQDGGFRFVVPVRQAWQITVDGGDGHQAMYTVSADELPASLPGPGLGLGPGLGPGPGVRAASPEPAAGGQPDTGPLAGEPVAVVALEPALERAVARQLRPLREQLEAWQEKLWWHDVAGGLGYIVGLAGLAYGLRARRRRTPAVPGRAER